MPRRGTPPSPFKRFNSSPEVIRLVMLMYIRFPLSLRNVEDLLAERGQPGFREVFDTGDEIIGENVDPVTQESTPTPRGTIHYGNRGAHIVPAPPRAPDPLAE